MPNIRLWHSEEMKQWRWTMVDDDLNMHSGQEPDIRDATVSYTHLTLPTSDLV